MISKVCANCGKPFEARFPIQKFCCYECYKANTAKAYKKKRDAGVRFYVPRIPKIAICPDCGAEYPKVGNQQRCIKCCEVSMYARREKQYKKYLAENGMQDLSLEESQNKILTCPNGVEVLNNPMGQMMARGDQTDKEVAESQMITVEELRLKRCERTILSKKKERQEIKKELNILSECIATAIAC